MGVDIQGPEGVILDLGHRIATIRRCEGIQANLSVIPRTNQRIRRAILSQAKTTIAARTIKNVPINKPKGLPEDRDLLFEPHYNNSTKQL